MYTISEIVWWTYDDYKELLTEQKKTLPNLIGKTGGYYDEEGVLHKEAWTQEMVDEAIARYEQILESIKNGAKVSKPIDGDENIGYVLNPTKPPAVSHSTEFSSGKFKGVMRQVGSPDGEIQIKAVRDYSKLDANGYGTLTGIEVMK